MAKPMRALELHHPMTHFLIMNFLLGFQSGYKWAMEGGGGGRYLGGLITGLKKAFKNNLHGSADQYSLFLSF